VSSKSRIRLLSTSGQGGQPGGVDDVGLAARRVFDPSGVDQHHVETGLFEPAVRALPIDAGAFHRHALRPHRDEKFGHGVDVLFESAVFGRGEAVVGIENGDDQNPVMDVDAGGDSHDLVESLELGTDDPPFGVNRFVRVSPLDHRCPPE
jgi:hypothetical protein